MEQRPEQTPAPASRTAIAVLVVALIAALVAGAGVYLWQGAKQQDELDTAQAQAMALRNQVNELERQQAESEQLVQKLKDQLKHEQKQHANAQDQLTQETTTDLSDGRYMVNIKAADAASDPQTVTVDVLQWFTGDAANKAAKEDGQETPVPNDYYIRNESKQLRTLDVASGTQPEVLYWHRDLIQDGKVVPFDVFANVMNGSASWQRLNQDGLYWVTLDNGQVTKIQVQFVP